MTKKLLLQLALLGATILPSIVLAQSWAEPDCNPATDPASCNVAAPLNVSASGQTKAGALTISGALSGGSTLSALGATTLSTTLNVTGTSTLGTLVVNGTSSTFNSQAIFNNTVNATSTFTYSGTNFVLPIEPNEVIADNEVSNTLTASIFKGTGSSSNAVDLATGEVAGTLPSASVTDAWVNTNSSGDTMTGPLTITPSTAVSGLTITPNATASGINVIGSSSQPLVSLSPTGSGNGLYITASAATSTYAVNVVTATTTATAHAMYVNSTGSATRSVYGRNVATSGYAVYGLATGTGGAGVGASSSNGYGVVGTSTSASYPGGYFYNATANSTSLEITGASSGSSSIGIDLVNTVGIGVNITASGGRSGMEVNATGSTTGILVDAENLGLDITASTGISVNSTGSVAIDVTGGDTGLNISGVTTAIQTNGLDVQNQGPYYGGQFYPYETTGQGTFNGSGIYEVENDGGSPYHPIALAHDESQAYLLTDDDLIIFDPRNTEEILTESHALSDPVDMIVRDDYIYMFDGASSSYYRYNRTSASTTSSTTGATAYPNAVATDGDSAWIGTDSTVQEWSSFSTIQTRATGLSSISDILVAGQYVYAASGAGGEVYKILRDSPYTATTINVGGIPTKMTYDGQYIWITDSGRYGLIKLNTNDDSYTVYEDVLSSESEGPHSVTFDGTYLWIGFSGLQLGKYHIATNTLVEDEGLSAYSVFSPTNDRVTDVMFDGTYIWAVTNTDDGGELTKISSGQGTSSGVPLIHNGIMIFDTDGDPYCLYLDSSGNVTTATSTTNCL